MFNGALLNDFNFLSAPAKVNVAVCSDDNYPFMDFLQRGLYLPEGSHFIFRLPGGFAPLAYPHHSEKVETLRQAIIIYLEGMPELRPHIPAFIVITHERCGFYKKFLPQFVGKEREDGAKIAEAITEILPNHSARVEVYHAMPREKKVYFHRSHKYKSQKPDLQTA